MRRFDGKKGLNTHSYSKDAVTCMYLTMTLLTSVSASVMFLLRTFMALSKLQTKIAHAGSDGANGQTEGGKLTA